MEEKTIEIVAEINIPIGNPLFSNNLVRFTFQSEVESPWRGVNKEGRPIYVFDHRETTLRKIDDKEALISAIQLPAIVTITKLRKFNFIYRSTESRSTPQPQLINLYPTNGQKPTALFSVTSYVGAQEIDLYIKENNAFWSCLSESTSGNYHGLILAALTDDEHRIIVYNGGKKLRGDYDTIIGKNIKRLALALY